VENKTHFILSTKSCMLQHPGTIFRGFIKKKDCQSKMYLCAIAICPLYVCDSDMETQVNIRRCVTEGL